MPKYTEGTEWSGQSWNSDAQRLDENHESDVSFAEVCRLIGSSISLFPEKEITGGGAIALNAFKEGLLSDDTEFTVVKGIHMRNSDPHIRASMNHNNRAYQYHINLQPGSRCFLNESGSELNWKKSRFVWQVTQVSVGIDKVYYKWPVAEPPVVHGNRKRGYSFTEGQMVEHVNAAKAAIAAREKADAEKKALAAKALAEKQALADAEAKVRMDASAAQRAARSKAGGNPWGAIDK